MFINPKSPFTLSRRVSVLRKKYPKTNYRFSMIHDTKKQNPFASPGAIPKNIQYIAVGIFRSDAGIWNHPVERKKTYSPLFGEETIIKHHHLLYVCCCFGDPSLIQNMIVFLSHSSTTPNSQWKHRWLTAEILYKAKNKAFLMRTMVGSPWWNLSCEMFCGLAFFLILLM